MKYALYRMVSFKTYSVAAVCSVPASHMKSVDVWYVYVSLFAYTHIFIYVYVYT